MKRETLKETHKGFINIGNGIIIVTVINGLFNLSKLDGNSLPVVCGISLYAIFSGIILKEQMMSNLVMTYIGVGIVGIIGLIFAFLVKPDKKAKHES